MENVRCDQVYLTADHPGEVGLLRRVDVQLGLVGALALVLSRDHQGEGVVVADVDLLPVAAANQRTQTVTTSNNSLTPLCLHDWFYLIDFAAPTSSPTA